MKLAAVVKRDCETCRLVEPVLAQIRERAPLSLYSQDDPSFPERLGGAVDDTALERSWRLRIETVPTLIRFEGESEVARIAGWDRTEWERVAHPGPGDAGAPRARPWRSAPELAPHRCRRPGGCDRSCLRSRLVRRAADRPADAAAGGDDALRHHAQARALGLDPGVAWAPHPIQNRTAGELEAIADGVLEEVLALIKN